MPPEIGQLTNLAEHVLSHNQLTALPPEIGQLTNLIRLFIYANRLTVMPLEISQLANLIELYHPQESTDRAAARKSGKLTNLTGA